MQIPFSEIFSSVEKIVLDSREDCSKGLFVPIKGEKQDGHRFIPMAIEHGASFIFTEEDCSELSKAYPAVRFIPVESTIDALQALGGYARSLYSGLVIGVTGSVGKTTTRAMIAKALSMEKSVFETKGNANSQLGLPITLFSMAKENKEISVIELGISIPGEMHRIAEIASCDIAVFTNIGSAHLENLKTKENTCFEKMHILEGQQKEVSLYLPKKDAILGQLSEEKIRAMGFLGEKKLNLFFYEKQEEIPLSVPGEHMEDNASVAMAIGLSLGMHKENLLQGLLEFQGLKGRGGRLSTDDGIMIIDDSYNASPDSMKASLKVLASEEGQRKIAVLGDMNELGDNEIAYHREIGEFLKDLEIDGLFTLGKKGEEIRKAMGEKLLPGKACFSLEELFLALEKEIKPGDLLLFKASNSLSLSTVIQEIRSKHCLPR
jgi:UDP-N-acetylmuramoyl-tripeptide--D-alanyl-D-alanine ligase